MNCYKCKINLPDGSVMYSVEHGPFYGWFLCSNCYHKKPVNDNCCKHCPEEKKNDLIEILLSNTSFCGLDLDDRLLQAEHQAKAVRKWIKDNIPEEVRTLRTYMYMRSSTVDEFLNNLGIKEV